MKKQVDVPKEVMRGIVDLIRHRTFFGHICQQLSKVFLKGEYDPSNPNQIMTMGVGKRPDEMLIKLYVHEAFVKGIWDKARDEAQACEWLLGVLEHEVLHCFPSGTMVGGMFDGIEHANAGSQIIGSDGSVHLAKNAKPVKFDGDMFRVKARGVEMFDVTENHLILTADIAWKTINNEVPRRNIRILRNVGWTPSQCLKKGDWLLIPRIKGTRTALLVVMLASPSSKRRLTRMPW